MLQTLKSKGLNQEGSKDVLASRLARCVAGLPSVKGDAPSAAKGKGKGKGKNAGSGRAEEDVDVARKVGGGGRTSSGPSPIGTLVVCPMSVIGNWENQLQEHVKEGALKASMTCPERSEISSE